MTPEEAYLIVFEKVKKMSIVEKYTNAPITLTEEEYYYFTIYVQNLPLSVSPGMVAEGGSVRYFGHPVIIE